MDTQEYETARSRLFELGLPFTHGGGRGVGETVELQYLCPWDGDWRDILADVYLLEAQGAIEIAHIHTGLVPDVLSLWLKVIPHEEMD